MSRTLSLFLRQEYDRFCDVAIHDWNVDPDFLSSVSDEMKAMYRRYLSLACAATVAGYRRQRNEYAEGVVEGGILSLIMALKGLENPSCVLMRQSIELVLKHIYFWSHPTEYQWAKARVDYKDLTFQFLIEYVGRTDEYRGLSDSHAVCEKLAEWYGILSRYVHVHSRGFMHYSKSGSGYRPTREHVKKLRERVDNIWPCLILLLCIFEKKRFLKASHLEQQLIRNGLPESFRTFL